MSTNVKLIVALIAAGLALASIIAFVSLYHQHSTSTSCANHTDGLTSKTEITNYQDAYCHSVQ